MSKVQNNRTIEIVMDLDMSPEDFVKVYVSTYDDYIHPFDYDDFYPNELGDVIFSEDEQEAA